MENKVIIPEGYVPTENEEFMNPVMLEYFRQKLLVMREELSSQLNQIMGNVVDSTIGSGEEVGDSIDKANDETLRQLDLSTTDNLRVNIDKIDLALKRIQDGTYGYCVITGEPISVKRLDARPLSSKTLEAQEEFEEENNL